MTVHVVHLPVSRHHGPVVVPVGVSVGLVPGISLPLAVGLESVSLMTVHVVHLPVSRHHGPVVAVSHPVVVPVGVSAGLVPGISIGLSLPLAVGLETVSLRILQLEQQLDG